MLESACCCCCCCGFLDVDGDGDVRGLAPLDVGGLLVGAVLTSFPAVVLLPLAVDDAANEGEII